MRMCVFLLGEGGSLILVSIGIPLYLVAFPILPNTCVLYVDIGIYNIFSICNIYHDLGEYFIKPVQKRGI